MTFEERFGAWLEAGLFKPVPNSVRGFAFNLFESGLGCGAKFGIELVGANRFDADDADWACDETWEPEDRHLLIPDDYSGVDWAPCLAKMKALVQKELRGPTHAAKMLQSRQGVGIGFVDGELEIVWEAAGVGRAARS